MRLGHRKRKGLAVQEDVSKVIETIYHLACDVIQCKYNRACLLYSGLESIT